MIIKLSGLLIDKFEQITKARVAGEVDKLALKAVVYQPESHQVINVTVQDATYTKLEPLNMKPITLSCEVGTFVSNGKAIQYFKEVA